MRTHTDPCPFMSKNHRNLSNQLPFIAYVMANTLKSGFGGNFLLLLITEKGHILSSQLLGSIVVM